jgi:SAM-dependent methyltransferase
VSPTLYTGEYYQNIIAGSRRSAEIVVPLILGLVHPRSVVDLGCGVGTWPAVFREHGIKDILGVDGDHIDRAMLVIPPDHFLPFDLRQPFRLDRRFDLAVSVEVAEHLPPECANVFVSSLVGLAPVVLFSAAIPYQGGEGHINEQWPEYWAGRFRRHGYLVSDPIRGQVWDNPGIEWWYAQNLLVFVQASHLGDYPGLREAQHGLPIVHPRKYLQNSVDHLGIRGGSGPGGLIGGLNGSANWLRRLRARLQPPEGRH